MAIDYDLNLLFPPTDTESGLERYDELMLNPVPELVHKGMLRSREKNAWSYELLLNAFGAEVELDRGGAYGYEPKKMFDELTAIINPSQLDVQPLFYRNFDDGPFSATEYILGYTAWGYSDHVAARGASLGAMEQIKQIINPLERGKPLFTLVHGLFHLPSKDQVVKYTYRKDDLSGKLIRGGQTLKEYRLENK